jgi:hypothetical protein
VINTVDRAYMFDNSGKEHRMIAEFQSGHPVHIDHEKQPAWFVEHVLEKLKR